MSRNTAYILEELERVGSVRVKALVRELDAALREERSRWTFEMQEQSRGFRAEVLKAETDRDEWRGVAELLHREAPPAARVATKSEAERWEDAKGALYALRARASATAAIVATPEQIARLNELMREEHWCPQCGEGAKAMTPEHVERPQSNSPALIMTCRKHGAQRHDAHDTDCWCLK